MPDQPLDQQRCELQDAQLRAGPLEPAGASDRYYSREQRERLAQRLAALNVPASTVDAVVLADTGQAQPAELAAAVARSRYAAAGLEVAARRPGRRICLSRALDTPKAPAPER